MIIVSGVDNTGKTCLVNHLSSKFGIPIADRYHTLPPKDYHDWYLWVKERLEDPQEFIYDRFFIEELVYGPVIRGGYGCSIAEMAELAAMLVIKQPFFIYTRLPTEVILKNFEDRAQYPKPEEVRVLVGQFLKVLNNWPVRDLANQVRHNYTIDSDYSKIDQIMKDYLRRKTNHG